MSSPFAGDSIGADGVPPPTVSLALEGTSSVGEARRLAGTFAMRAGLGEAERSNLAIVVTELAGNAVKHGGGGEMIVRLIGGSPAGVEAICIDSGPGIANIAEAMRDGHSTTKTMGTGLGAARRLSHRFEIHSLPGAGTATLARMWAGAAPDQFGYEAGGVAVPVKGETECGDAWAFVCRAQRAVVMLADGLGHGAQAAEAAKAAVRAFHVASNRGAAEIITAMHGALRETRGAAVAVAEIDRARSEVRYAGVGNIAGLLVAGTAPRWMVSQNGIVGHQPRPVHETAYPWTSETAVVLHSDGIRNGWKPEGYPGLLRRDPALATAVLYRDFGRGRDDSSAVICRLGSPSTKARAE
ncbi:MAG TPA: ATP-binding SpoIIE family protein phosphatase [Gemmatimonadales bacterium]